MAENGFQLFGYPIATVIAEKLSTAVALGDLNTRDRDYADLYRLICSNNLDGTELTNALQATAIHRGIRLRGLKSSILHLPQLRQRSYAAWRRRQGAVSTAYPELFSDVIDLVVVFAEPLLEGRVTDKTWVSRTQRWERTERSTHPEN